MDIEKEEMQAKGIGNIFKSNRNFPNFEKEMVIQLQDLLGHHIDKI
jgi:hypothetical protein